MYRIALLYLILVFVSLETKTQAQIPRLKSSGLLPETVSKSYFERFDKTLENVKNEINQEQNRKDFAALTNYSINRLLKSGDVVYGDPITNMCNDIVKRLVHGQEINQDIEVYTWKSSSVNAYSTHQGLILVTTGLISRLNNEHQLAFVLAHELAHIKLSHVLQSFEFNESKFKKETFDNSKNELALLQSARHSRNAERAADKLGFEYFNDARYNYKEAISVFDKLLYGYLPIAQIPLNYDELEDEYFKLSEKATNAESVPIMAAEDVDDSKLSHPNTRSRKATIHRAKNSKRLRTDEVIKPSSEFVLVKDIAIKECLRQHIIFHEYLNVIVQLDALGERYSQDEDLHNYKAMAWYGILLFKVSGQMKDVIGSVELQGDQNSYRNAFAKMKNGEIAVLCLRELWKLDRQKSTVKTRRFLNQALNVFKTKVFPKRELDSFRLSNSDSIDLEKANEKCYMCHYGFRKIDAQSQFEDFFNLPIDSLYSKRTISVDSNKLSMFTPSFATFDKRKPISERYAIHEDRQLELTKHFTESGEKLSINIDIVDEWSNQQMSTEELNKFGILTDWVYERVGYLGKEYQGFWFDEMNIEGSLINSPYLGLSYYWNFTEPKPFDSESCAMAVIYVVYLPFYLIDQLTPYHYSGFGFVVINVETGEVGFNDSKHFDRRYKSSRMKAHIYDSLNQLVR